MKVSELRKEHPVEIKTLGPGLTLASFNGKEVKIIGTKEDKSKAKPRFFVQLAGTNGAAPQEALATKNIHDWCKEQLDWLRKDRKEASPSIEGTVKKNEKRGYTLE